MNYNHRADEPTAVGRNQKEFCKRIERMKRMPARFIRLSRSIRLQKSFCF